jgi:uncharacterized membrane protein YphA (DoxX/SURF4 family)
MMESAPFNYRRLVVWIGRIVMGGIFLYAGYTKVFLPNKLYWPLALLKFSVTVNLLNFRNEVEAYKMLSDAGVSFVTYTLPFAEIILGVLLLIGWRLRVWATLLTAIMLGFFFVVTRAYILHLPIKCGCFGTDEPLTGFTVLRDGAMAALSVLMTLFAFQESRKPHPWTAPAEASQL